MDLRRRTYLRTAGVVVAAGISGCLGGDEDPEAANEFGYETTTTDGVDVPLVPVADAVEWYRDDAAAFADARSRTAYEKAHVAEAVLSPAPDGQESNDPVTELPSDARVVTYCGCPHHLSTLRGASLIRDGYVHTYAIDEGFRAWVEAGYPIDGEAAGELQESPTAYHIDGRTDAAHAGDLAWAWHDASGQREAAPIGDDGTFTLTIRFHDVAPDAQLRLQTPAGEVIRPLEELVEQTVEV